MAGSAGREQQVARLELQFSPSIELISLVRRFVFDFYHHVLRDEDAVSRVALATHELLENAVRYSTNGVASVCIGVSAEDQPDEETRTLTIRIENQAEESHRIALTGIFDELKEAGCPLQHYQKLMARNANRVDGSGLGLARIRAEAEMDLDCEIDEDRVRILARTGVFLRPQASGTTSS